MKLLLIGPCPPPHGGISVHVIEAKRQLERSNIPCRILNLNCSAPKSTEYISCGNRLALLVTLVWYACRGWTLHLHTNGHNDRSWFLALACGIAGQFAPACILTVHSGMAPQYLRHTNFWQRWLTRSACWLYGRIVAVTDQIREALSQLEVSAERLQVLPAYLPTASSAAIPAVLEDLVRESKPLVTTVLFFRPEYGFDLLVEVLVRLRRHYPNLRCLAMGSGEQQKQAEQLVRDKGMEQAIVLLGDQPHELCLALIAASDLFVRPTLQDGDSISVREALALGVPTVVSDAGYRPQGTFQFRRGDRSDLLCKMRSALVTPRYARGGTVMSPSRVPNRVPLLDIYGRTAVQGVQP